MKTQLITSPEGEKEGLKITQFFGNQILKEGVDDCVEIEEFLVRGNRDISKDFTRFTGKRFSNHYLTFTIADVKEVEVKGKKTMRVYERSISIDKDHIDQLIDNLKTLSKDMLFRGERS